MNWEELKEAKLPIVLYGMGDGADRILAALAAHGLQAAGVFASDEFVRGQVFHSFPVLRYEEAKRRFGRMLVLLAFGTGLPAVLARIDQIAQLLPVGLSSFGDRSAVGLALSLYQGLEEERGSQRP